MITQISAYTSYILVSEIGQVHSDIVTCGLRFSVDLDVATFIFPSSLNINDGYVNNSKANTTSACMLFLRTCPSKLSCRCRGCCARMHHTEVSSSSPDQSFHVINVERSILCVVVTTRRTVIRGMASAAKR